MNKKYMKPRIIEVIKPDKVKINDLAIMLERTPANIQKEILRELKFKLDLKEELLKLKPEIFSEIMKSKELKNKFFLFVSKHFNELTDEKKIHVLALLENLKYDAIQVFQNIIKNEKNESIKTKAFEALKRVTENHPGKDLILRTAEKNLKEKSINK